MTGGSPLAVRRAIPLLPEDAENGLSSRMRRTIAELYDLFNDLGHRIHFLIRKLKQYSGNQKPVSVSPKLKALALKWPRPLLLLLAKEMNLRMAATLLHGWGLVPRQHSSGDRQVLMNMTKKGDKHLRTLFIHGARAVVRVATNNNDGHMNQWVNQLKKRRGFNTTTVAVADKNARIIWSMLRNETGYQVV